MQVEKKYLYGLILTMLSLVIISCNKDSPTESSVTFSLTDLVGRWAGTIQNSSNTINLDMTVDNTGKATGSGVSSTWSIDDKGKITGGGSFGFITGSSYVVAGASWSLQLSSNKTNLSGKFNVAYSGLHDMDVNLTKSAASFLIAYITSPYDSSSVSDTVDIVVTARSSTGITKVEFYIDESIISTDTSLPYSYAWNTTAYSNGSHAIKIIAYDTDNQTAIDQHTVFVGNAKWEFLTGDDVRGSSPAIDSDGTIYIGSRDNKLYAINPDGTKKWEFLAGSDVESSPSIGSDGTIYVGSGYEDKLYAINPDGTKKWEFLTGGNVESSPAIGSDGTIYVGSAYPDYGLYAINPDGTERWKFLTNGYVESSPAIGSDGTIYVSSDDDKLYAINPDGTKKWEYLTGGGKSSPAIDSDGTIYVGSDDKILFAINPDGTKKWEFLTGGYIFSSSPALSSDGTIYIGSYDKKLYAINPDGTKKWEFLTGDDVRSSPALGSDGTIYVGSYDDKLYAINPDGTEKWEFETGGNVDSSPTIGPDGTIYFGSWDGKIYAIHGSAGLASTPWPMFHHDLKHTGRIQ